jgi:hypothetical protein
MRSPNGWRRLGVLLSVLWVLAVAGLALAPATMPNVGGWVYSCSLASDPLCLFEELNYRHLAALVVFPLLFGWALGYGVAWVRRGFGGG